MAEEEHFNVGGFLKEEEDKSENKLFSFAKVKHFFFCFSLLNVLFG